MTTPISTPAQAQSLFGPTPTYPAYPSTPAYAPTTQYNYNYGQDQFSSGLNQLASQVQQLEQQIRYAGSAAYGNYQYQQAVTNLTNCVNRRSRSLVPGKPITSRSGATLTL